MHCTNCGQPVKASDPFCRKCGNPTTPSVMTPPAPPALSPFKGGLKKSWSNLPTSRKVLLLTGITVVLVVIVVIVVIQSKNFLNSTQTSNTQFEHIGAYNPGTFKAGLEADSYYVYNPTKSAIRKFCEQQKSERLSDLKYYDRHLVISFYDDRDHTPNYTDGYDPSDESLDQYRVADYVINPVGGGTDEVNFSKEIPE